MSGVRRLVGPLAVTSVVTAVVRVLYAAALAKHPELAYPVLDGAANLEWARGLLAGTWPGGEPFFRPPGYLVALAAFLRVTGDSVPRVVDLQLALGTITPLLTCLLAARLAGPAAAWIAGPAAAVYPAFLFFDGQLLTPFLVVPLVLGAVLAGDLAREGRRGAWAVAAGWMAGIAGVAWPLVLPVGAWLVFDVARAGRRGAAALTAVALLAAPLAATVHNLRAGDRSFVASQGGLNLYLGNAPGANGMSATFADAPTALGYRMMEAATRQAEAREGHALTPAQVSSHYVHRTLDGVESAPLAWLALIAKKTFLAFSAREIPNNHDLALFAGEIPLLRGPGWGLWLPFAVVGIWRGRRARSTRWVAGVAGIVLAGMVVFFVNGRFRVPAAPLVIALGSAGVVALAGSIVARRWRQVGAAGALLLVAAVVAYANPYHVPRRPWVISYLLVAEAERDRGEPVRALRRVEQALEEEPGLYAARLAKAELLRRTGRIAAARTEVESALKSLPEDAALRHEHAMLLDLSGETPAALAEVDRALRADPGLDAAYVTRAVILSRLGRKADARATLQALLHARPGSPDAVRARTLLAELAGGAPH